MSDDFGTVAARRADKGREIELLRQRYKQHRDALMRLVSDAPTEHLATEYHRLVRDVDASLAKLDELEGRAAAAAAAGSHAAAGTAAMTGSVPPAVSPRAATPVGQAHGDPLRHPAEPGMRPLAPTPGVSADEDVAAGAYRPPARPGAQSRVLLMTLAGLVVVALIGWLIWRASSERRVTSGETASAPAVTEPAPATVQPLTPAAPPAALVINPSVVDFGKVAKGTRAARQLEITNNGAAPAKIQVARSQCRCLYYEYAGTIEPKKKETITVTIDAARAKAGTLDETIAVTVNKDPSMSTQFQVTATVQ